jgi:hypothetical protein
LADIAEQISAQVSLLQSDSEFADLATARARLEAILHFASKGLHAIEQRQLDYPVAQGPSSVE